MAFEDECDDGMDWHCWFCGQGFFDGAPKFIVDEEDCCEGCKVDVPPTTTEGDQR